MEGNTKVTRTLLISGRVQGVGFRFYMERRAHELGVTGWVRNRRDGAVEAVVQGSREAVEAMEAWARRGPRNALVSDVKVTEGGGEYTEFSMLPSR